MIAQSPTALIFIDQHAAHERIIYETLLQGWKDGQVDIQSFLIPLTIDLEAKEVEALVSAKR